MNHKWNNKNILYLKDKYFYEDCDVLISNIGKSWNAIKIKAHKLNLKRDRSFANIKYFDKWSTDMAYILGFIAADGCIYSNKKINTRLEIQLAKKDQNLLEAIKNEIAPLSNIYKFTDKNGFNMVKLAITSLYMCNKIINLGITKRKSLTLDMPDIPIQYMSHFTRGYFDGDGSIGKYNNQWQMSILGTKSFLSKLNIFISDNLNVSLKNIRKKNNIYDLRYSTYDSNKISQWMYKDSTICLKRKFNLFMELAQNKGLSL